jgi:hypothetical protein
MTEVNYAEVQYIVRRKDGGVADHCPRTGRSAN